MHVRACVRRAWAVASLFQALDLNGDGSLSLAELTVYFENNGALEVLRRRIDAIEIDRAPFERIDAYVRAACGRLAPGGDEPIPFVGPGGES